MNMSFEGIDLMIEKLDKLSNKTTSVMKAALYEGAKAAADEVKAALNSLPVDEDSRGRNPYIFPGSQRRLKGVTSRQKLDIINSFGVTRHRVEEDGVTARVGFEGYTLDGANKNPVAVAVIVRSVESGTSFREKRPFIRSAIRRAKPKAEAAMQKKVEEIINKVNNS